MQQAVYLGTYAIANICNITMYVRTYVRSSYIYAQCNNYIAICIHYLFVIYFNTACMCAIYA